MTARIRISSVALAVSIALGHASVVSAASQPLKADSYGMRAIIGGDVSADAIIGGDRQKSKRAIIGGDNSSDAIIGGDVRANAIIGGDVSADAIIGGDRQKSKRAIIGGDNSSDAIIGGDVSADAIIGGDRQKSKRAIIGGDNSSDAIIGGDVRANAIIGGDVSADAIIGGDRQKSKRAIIGGDIEMMLARGVVAHGPIESIDPVKSHIVVLGQTFKLGGTAEQTKVLQDRIATGESVIATVSGAIGNSGTLKVKAMSLSHLQYVPGSTDVMVVGKVRAVDASLGTIAVGTLRIDYSAALAAGDLLFAPGQIVAVIGVQSAPGMPLIASSIKAL